MWKKLCTKKGIAWTTVGAVAVAGFGAGYVFGAFDGLAAAEGEPNGGNDIAVSADAYTSSAKPDHNAGSVTRLLTGGGDATGVTVTYLRFALTEAQAAGGLVLRLPVAETVDNELVEVAHVSPVWSESDITAAESPPMGSVLDTTRASTQASQLEFNLPAGSLRAGDVAFAVTTPAAKATLSFHSRESGVDAARLSPVRAESVADEPLPRQPEKGGSCPVGAKLVPYCGALLGVAPGAHTDGSKTAALRNFEDNTGRGQHIYHSYHRGDVMFPTREEIAVATEADNPRVLFLNWKPRGASWAEIAAGDPATDAYLERLAAHITTYYGDKPFFFTVHHEPEDDVRADPESGYTAPDYAAMFGHVVNKLRAEGVSNMVSVMVYMAYLKWTQQDWHDELYPGDSVVDWVAWDTYGYSDPGYGHGDFADIVNREGTQGQNWPGFYRWAAETFPGKPLMVAEWGVWYSSRNPDHQAEVFAGAADQLAHFPRLKAVVYFESASAEGRDSRVDVSPKALDAYRRFTDSRAFSVDLGLG
ncbi:glycoside hydrolase family 26 protein [Stackebrandtia nassauensis]|uniref:GH26 domain-containing protein n=1 Tax=Stackebrandtia nassauensis (strain DSM 44728 / CIP 108903 / NRRL B-16338 / NBRC 102104 / LLR-40K-21) TaxID=446470 RepID=D3Q952_STANL|nr:hypothetical protein [Stackebrandtia nassauensis]ADD40661.1 hypothetical protein Snas_0950 [Stackebrandtia nassauensis DSM 44728]